MSSKKCMGSEQVDPAVTEPFTSLRSGFKVIESGRVESGVFNTACNVIRALEHLIMSCDNAAK